MVILGIIFFILVSGFAWVLITPLEFYLNSREGVVFIRLKGITQFQVQFKDEVLSMAVKIMWWRIPINPFKKSVATLEKKDRKAPKPKKERVHHKVIKKINYRRIRNRINNLLGSFKIKKFYINLDTDDFPLNARLIPLFMFLSGNNRTLLVNFQGHNEIEINIKNRLIVMAYYAVPLVIALR